MLPERVVRFMSRFIAAPNPGRQHTVRAAAWPVYEAIMLALAVIVTFVIIGSRHFVTSNDLALHLSLIQYIYEHRAWPFMPDQVLVEMADYPPVAHTLVASLGWLPGGILKVLFGVCATSVFVTYLFLFLAARGSDLRRTLAVVILFALLLCVARIVGLHIFFVGGEVIGNFFFAQLVSFSCVIAAAYSVERFVAPPWRALVALAITFLFGWLFTMAAVQFAAIVMSARLLRLVERALRREARVSEIGQLLLFGALSALAILAHPRFSFMLGVSYNEGYINVTPPYLIAAFAVGALTFASMIVQRLVSKEPPDGLIVSICTGTWLAAAAQGAAKLAGFGSYYGVAKHAFPLTTTIAIGMAVLGGHSIARVLSRRIPKAHRLFGFGTLVCVSLATVAVLLPPTGGRSVGEFVKKRNFVKYALTTLPRDAFGNSIFLDVNAALTENAALSQAFLGLGKFRVLDYVFQVIEGPYRREPISYRFAAASSANDVDPVCIRDASPKLQLVVIDERCDLRAGQYSPGRWYVPRVTFSGGWPYLLSGWSHPEPWGVWTDGSVATLQFPPLRDIPAPLLLDMQTVVYVPDGKPQRVIAEVDGVRIADWQFISSNNDVSVEIPQRTVVPGKALTVTFRLPDARRPSESDPRLIGLGLLRARLVQGKTAEPN